MYCLSCKKETGNKDEETIPGDRPRLSAKCSDCGRNKSKFLPKKQTGKGPIDATISDAAYDKVPKEKIGDYVLDPELSKDKTRVYVDNTNNKVIVSHRGTADKADVVDDLKIGLNVFSGKTSSRVKEAKQVAKAAESKYGNSTITNVGHSLGGTLAEKAAGALSVNNSKVVGYNRGSSPLEIPKNLYNNLKCSTFGKTSDDCKRLKNIESNLTVVDPISISNLTTTGKVKVTIPKNINVHSISNFKKVPVNNNKNK